MKLLARLVLLATGLILLAHYLPAGYWLVAERQQRVPFVFYSCVSNEFLFNRVINGELRRTEAGGRILEREEFESLTPLDNYMQLYKDRRMPKEINGVTVTPEKLRRDRLNLRLKPAFLDSPAVPLYPLFESESGLVRLEIPPDVLRFTATGAEFIDVKSNAVAAAKSAKFQQAFATAGFAFPLKVIGGNPSALKPYDEGYFLADSSNVIYQLKQVRGEAALTRVADQALPEQRALWATLRPRFIHVQEQDNHEIRFLLIENSGQAHLAIGPNFRLVNLPLETYTPDSTVLNLRGDMLNRLLTVNAENEVEAIVFDRDYKVLDRYHESVTPRAERTEGKIAAAIFPFAVDFEDDNSGFIGFQFTHGTWRAWIVNAVWVALALGWLRWRQRRPLRNVPELAAVAIGGVFGAILLVLMPVTD